MQHAFVRAALLAVLFSLLCSPLGAGALRVAVVPGVSYSHFSPAAKLVEKLQQRGHQCLVFVPSFAHRQCRSYFRNPQVCVALWDDNQELPGAETAEIGGDEVFRLNISAAASYNRFLVTALSGTARLRVFEPDVFVADFSAFGTDAVAEAFEKPTVFMWWHQFLSPTDLSPSVPQLGSGGPRSMSFRRKVDNWAGKVRHNFWLNGKARRTLLDGVWQPAGVRAPPLTSLVESRHIITPGLLGVDLAVPTCPNVHRVGFLHSESDLRVTNPPSAWQRWINGCLYGLLYVNLPENPVMEALPFALADIVERYGACVVWKSDAAPNKELPPELSSTRVRVVEHIPFSQRVLLMHPATKLLITRCSQSTVQETIDSETAVLCVSDGDRNSDLLQRVEEGLVGDVVDIKVRQEELTDSVLYLFNNSLVFEAIRRVKRMGYLLGGAQNAAEVVEVAAELGREDRSFVCTERSFTVFALVGVLLLSFTLTLTFLLVACRLRCSWKSKEKLD